MASEIKIHLATYLKDAGIKASQQQIEQLSKKVVAANKAAQTSTNDLGGALGHLEGPLGKLQDKLGGIAGKALAVIAAFKTGWDIGNWIDEKVIRPLFKIKDPVEELKKHNREIRQQVEETAKAFDAAMAQWEKGWQAQVAGADEARQKVEGVTAAYLRMQQAREKVASVNDDATLIGLERDKYNAMTGAASPEAAAAAGKYHDVLIAEEQQKQKMAKYDRDAAAATVKQAEAEAVLVKATEKRDKLKRQMSELEQTQADLAAQDTGEMGFEATVKKEEELAAKKIALQQKIDAADREVGKRKTERDALAVEASTAEQARANLQERTQLEIDEKKKAYDEYCDYVEQQEAAAALDAWQKQQAEIARQVAEEKAQRVKMEQELAAQRISDLRAELTEQQRMQAEAQGRQGAADGKLTQAWSWYRNQGTMQAVIDEKKAQAEAEVQWQKDFERLKFRRRDWRTAEFGSLSAADESVRQVALAKEEKEAADKAVIETAENTRNLAQKLDELLQVKG